MDIEILDKNKICAPTVRIPFNILEEIKFIVAHESEEIGWYGTVKELPDNIYEIGEIFIPEQERNGGTCELSAEGLNNITSEIIKNPKLSNEEKEDKINSIAFWGHSHVNFGVSPSSQDIDNAKKHSGKPYLIAARFNKAGNIRIDFFDFKRGLLFNDVTLECAWAISPERQNSILKDIKNNVKKLEPKPLVLGKLEDWQGMPGTIPCPSTIPCKTAYKPNNPYKSPWYPYTHDDELVGEEEAIEEELEETELNANQTVVDYRSNNNGYSWKGINNIGYGYY